MTDFSIKESLQSLPIQLNKLLHQINVSHVLYSGGDDSTIAKVLLVTEPFRAISW